MVGPQPSATLATAQARRPMTARLRSLGEPGWSVPIVAILTYLFVVHSFRLPIGAAAIFAGLAGLALEGRRMRFPPFLLWFGAFLVWAAATLMMGWDAAHSYDQLVDFGKIWLITFLIANAARSEKQWRLVLVGWLAMFALFPFRGTAINFALGLSHAGRYAWNFTFQNPNDLAAISLLVFSLAFLYVRSPGPPWIRWSARLGALSMPLLILITGSRGALLGLIVFAAVMIAFSRRRLGTTALLATLALISLPFLPDNIKARFSGMKFLTDTETIGRADTSAEQRFQILQVASTVAKDHPVFGVGIGNYPLANNQYAPTRPEWWRAHGFRDAHNTYLTIAAETGIPGLLLMSAAAASVIFGLIRAHRKGAKLAPLCPDPVLREALINRPPALLAGLMAFLVTAMFGSLFYFTYPFMYAVAAQAMTSDMLERAKRMASSTQVPLGASAPGSARPTRRTVGWTRPRVA